MKKIIAKIFSQWGFVPLIMALLCNFAVYSGCNALTRNWNLHSLAIPLDMQIPLIPWTIVIYFGCYIFWIVNYILIYRRSREYAYRFFVADFLSRIVCLVFFVFYPTTLIRPAVEGEGIFYDAIRFLYKIDAPTNLFPSIHCLESWCCIHAALCMKKTPRWYLPVTIVMSLCVFASTLLVKQHVFIDIIGGILVFEAGYFIAKTWFTHAPYHT